GPMVMFGTKWPSITSTWTRVAPPSATACTLSARCAKSADKMEGASSTKMNVSSESYKNSTTLNSCSWPEISLFQGLTSKGEFLNPRAGGLPTLPLPSRTCVATILAHVFQSREANLPRWKKQPRVSCRPPRDKSYFKPKALPPEP